MHHTPPYTSLAISCVDLPFEIAALCGPWVVRGVGHRRGRERDMGNRERVGHIELEEKVG